jgi:ATP-dependent DNA helicase RecQ
MIDWLRGRKTKLIETDVLKEWLNAQPSGWWSLLREAVEEYALETGGNELPLDHFIEWLAEWGREVRRRQAGLLLLTAHRAKGLEFKHVAILDGGWQRVDKNEDADASRRLYYVAMTRARETLLLARLSAGNIMLDELPDEPCFLSRTEVPLPLPAPELARLYMRLTLADVNLGFAGHHAPEQVLHQAIAGLTVNSPLFMSKKGDQRNLLDDQGNVIGRLAQKFSPPAGMKCIEARVFAIIVRRREDEGVEFQDRVCCDRWEVVLPELIFEPV